MSQVDELPRPAIEQRLGLFGLVGDVTSFLWRSVREIRHVRPFAGEVLRQTALIAAGSTLVILVATFLIGSSCGQVVSASARALGIEAVGQAGVSSCSTRNVVPFLFGFILAAKTGCGFVAVLGSMRVREEVDALEVMGIRPLAYLVSTRILAATLVLPFIYWLAIASAHLGSYIQSVIRYGDVSQGTFEFFFYGFLDLTDLIFVAVQGLLLSTVVITVSLYYGYHVRGGPVEVGVATARSMAVNLTLATLINLGMTAIFLLRPVVPVA